jgi:ATP-binding protein involved in chromosome partitioning
MPDGSIHDIFGRGGTQKASTQLGVPFLGELPLFPQLRINSDTGKPHANFEVPALRDSLEAIVKRLAGEVSKRNLQAPAPSLEIT